MLNGLDKELTKYNKQFTKNYQVVNKKFTQ